MRRLGRRHNLVVQGDKFSPPPSLPNIFSISEYFLWLLSWRWANKKIEARLGNSGLCLLRLVQTNLSHLFNLTHMFDFFPPTPSNVISQVVPVGWGMSWRWLRQLYVNDLFVKSWDHTRPGQSTLRWFDCVTGDLANFDFRNWKATDEDREKLGASFWRSQDPHGPSDDDVDDRLSFAITFFRINNVIFWLLSPVFFLFLNVSIHTVTSFVGPNEHYTLYSIQQTPVHFASCCVFYFVLWPPSCRTPCDDRIFRNPYDYEVMWLCVAARNLFKYGILIHFPITGNTEWRSIPFIFYIQRQLEEHAYVATLQRQYSRNVNTTRAGTLPVHHPECSLLSVFVYYQTSRRPFLPLALFDQGYVDLNHLIAQLQLLVLAKRKRALSVKFFVESSWNVMAHGDAREGKWRGNWRMEWVSSTLHTTSEHGVSSITNGDAHTSAASSRLNWPLRRFKWTRTFRRKTKSGFSACAITFQTQSSDDDCFLCVLTGVALNGCGITEYFYRQSNCITSWHNEKQALPAQFC